MDYKDYYRILGVDKKADEKTIKDAYRKLAKKYHPDYNQGNKKSEDKFKEINEANEVLSDKGKREKYDSMGSDWQQYAQQGQQQRPRQGGYTQYSGNSGGFDDSVFGEGGFSDFFRTFFGGEGRGANPSDFESYGGNSPAEDTRRGDVEAKIELDLKDSFLGGDKTFQLSMQDECYSCGGRGVLGRNQSCSACAGNGITIKNKKITVKIPAGVKDGSKIRIAGQGNKSSNGRTGDLYLVVKIRPHRFFEVEGNNINCEVPVTVSELVLGANIEIPTFKNKVTIKVPPGTQNGSVFRLKGQGLAGLGDLMVKLKVAVPKVIGTKEKALYEELKALDKKDPRQDLYL